MIKPYVRISGMPAARLGTAIATFRSSTGSNKNTYKDNYGPCY